VKKAETDFSKAAEKVKAGVYTGQEGLRSTGGGGRKNVTARAWTNGRRRKGPKEERVLLIGQGF
jgi:hypothetical protein